MSLKADSLKERTDTFYWLTAFDEVDTIDEAKKVLEYKKIGFKNPEVAYDWYEYKIEPVRAFEMSKGGEYGVEDLRDALAEFVHENLSFSKLLEHIGDFKVELDVSEGEVEVEFKVPLVHEIISKLE